MPKVSADCPFARRLRYERERLGLTQAELATMLSVSPRAVWQWENGKEPIALTQEGVIARLVQTPQKQTGERSLEMRSTSDEKLRRALKRLIRLYVCNLGKPDHEFIACITPRHASDMTKKDRQKCRVWSAWDGARAALKQAKGAK